MTVELPPTPPELAARIIGDVASNARFPVESVAARVADGLRAGDGGSALIRAEELARAHVDDLWLDEGLADAYRHALAAVRDAYLAQADLIAQVSDDLDERGQGAWIARALAHQFATHAAWEALDRAGELTEFPDEALCACCGSPLGGASMEAT